MYFSVIIPLYNKENHILRAIYSVLKQTHPQFEIIVIDDGSTDSSFYKVKDVEDPRLKVFIQNNMGVSTARNHGIQKARHDYIAFLDADDTWKSQFLEYISKLINDFPQAGAYTTNYEFVKYGKITNTNIKIDLGSGESDIVNYFKGAQSSPLISASSVVIQKNVFDNIGLFSTDLTRGEDLEMWCRIALKYQIAYLNEVLVSYYRDTDNRATNESLVYSKAFMSRAEDLLREQEALGNKSIYFKEYMISRIMNKVRYLIYNNQIKEARKLLWKYKHTKFNKKKWIKNYILSFKLPYLLHKAINKD